MKPRRYLVVLFCALLTSSWACFANQGGAAADELLDPAHAFKLSVHRVKGDALEIQFDIAEGYYLYRDRFKLRVNGRETPRSELHWPKGLQVVDPNFGKVVTFRRAVRLRPASLLSANIGKEGRVNLEVTSQGCADVGVCFPPLRQSVVISRDEAYAVPGPALPETAQTSRTLNSLTNELVRKAAPR